MGLGSVDLVSLEELAIWLGSIDVSPDQVIRCWTVRHCGASLYPSVRPRFRYRSLTFRHGANNQACKPVARLTRDTCLPHHRINACLQITSADVLKGAGTDLDRES